LSRWWSGLVERRGASSGNGGGWRWTTEKEKEEENLQWGEGGEEIEEREFKAA